MSVNVVALLVILIVLMIICIAVLIFNTIRFKRYSNKYEQFWSKFENENIEKDIEVLINNMRETQNKCEENDILCKSVEEKMIKCIQKVGFVKYDAYESGNNGLSFALALLDNNNNGILINNIYTRNGSNIYAKEINNGDIAQNISEEERKALEKALKNKTFM